MLCRKWEESCPIIQEPKKDKATRFGDALYVNMAGLQIDAFSGSKSTTNPIWRPENRKWLGPPPYFIDDEISDVETKSKCCNHVSKSSSAMTLALSDIALYRKYRYIGHQIGNNHIFGCETGTGEIPITVKMFSRAPTLYDTTRYNTKC